MSVRIDRLGRRIETALASAPRRTPPWVELRALAAANLGRPRAGARTTALRGEVCVRPRVRHRRDHRCGDSRGVRQADDACIRPAAGARAVRCRRARKGRSASVPAAGRLAPAFRWLCVSRRLAVWDGRELVEQASWAPEWRRVSFAKRYNGAVGRRRSTGDGGPPRCAGVARALPRSGVGVL